MHVFFRDNEKSTHENQMKNDVLQEWSEINDK